MTPAEANLALYRFILKGRWWLIVAAAVCGGALAGAVLWFLPPKYEATTSVQITPIIADPYETSQRASTLIDRQTEATIARSMAVAELAVAELDGSLAISDVRNATSITPIADTTILNISFQADNAKIAQQGADAMASAYLTYRAAQAELEVGTLRSRLASQLEQLRQDLGEANTLAALADPDSREASQAISDRDLIMAELNGLVSRKNNLDAISTTGGSTLTAASGNPVTVSPSRTTLLTSGVFGGLLIGIVLSFTIKTTNIRFRTPKQLETFVGVPVVGNLTAAPDGAAVTRVDQSSLLNIREEILHRLESGTILILDDAGIGRGVAFQLGSALAQVGAEVNLFASVDEGFEPEEHGLSAEEFDFDSDQVAENTTHYAVDSLSKFRLFLSTSTDGAENFDAALAGILPERVREAQPATFNIIYLRGDEAQTVLLTAMRFTDVALISVQLKRVKFGALSTTIDKFQQYGIEELGVLAVTRGSKKTRPTEQKEIALAVKAEPA